MRTDDLIDRLSGALEPVPPLQVLRVLALGLGAGAVLSALLMIATIAVIPLLIAFNKPASSQRAPHTVAVD